MCEFRVYYGNFEDWKWGCEVGVYEGMENLNTSWGFVLLQFDDVKTWGFWLHWNENQRIEDGSVSNFLGGITWSGVWLKMEKGEKTIFLFGFLKIITYYVFREM